MFPTTLKTRIKRTATSLCRISVAAAAAGFWLAPCPMAMADGSGEPEEAAAEVVIVDEQPEDSVLVATRQDLQEEYAAPEGSLEPISHDTEHEPEPADPPGEEKPVAEEEPAIEAAPATEAKSSTESKPLVAVAAKRPADQSTTAKAEDAMVEVTDAPAPRVATRVSTPGDVAAALLQEETKVAAAPFKGIVAGQSTRQELISLWGEPSDTRQTPEGEVLNYDQDNFAAIEVLVKKDLVQLVKAELEKQSQPERLAARLHVDLLDSVTIKDEETGEDLGVVYPEKGLMLLLNLPTKDVTPITPQFVTHLVLQAPDAEAFALRAQTRPVAAYGKRLADLNRALAIDKQNAYAQWLRSGVYLSTGQPVKAEEDAAAALKQNETNAAYRLRWAETLAAIGRYDDAVLETRKVIDAPDDSQLVKAQALALMGRLASLGDAQIAEKAIGFHTAAIAMADKLATSSDAAERRAAKRLLIDSHLAVAIEVSRRSYDDKSEVVAQWIGRASGLAEEMINNEEASLQLRLLVARQSLESLANLKPSKDPGPWVKEASEAAQAIVSSTDDDLQKHRAHWELGQSLFHALRVSHSRREADRAIGYGEKAIDHLAEGAATGDVRPEAEQMVGRLYFHLGAAHAVHKQDHAAAVEWYEQSQPLMLTEIPKSELVIPRQLGEALVSMGVSYWDQDQQPKAIELTVEGAEIMQQAVEAGVLDPGAMAVPYGNLATMHRKQGNGEESAKYAALAAGARGAKTQSDNAMAKQPQNGGQQRSAQTPGGARTASRDQKTTKSSSTSKSKQRRSTRKTILR